MARRKEEQYVFNATTGTVKVPGHLNINDVLSIINVTTGETIYTLGDPAKTFVSKVHSHPLLGDDPDFPWSIDGVCTFDLLYDTSINGQDTDELIIFVEDERKGLVVRPFDAAVDAVERIKVSNPETLIDADFEYGLQSSKWHNVGFNTGYPSFSEGIGVPLEVTSVSAVGNTVTVTVANSAALAANTAFTITGLSEGFSDAEGSFVVSEQVDASNFRYKAKDSVAGVSVTPVTTLRPASIFDQAALNLERYDSNSATNDAVLTFREAHGLFPGSPFLLVDTTAGSQEEEGPFFVTEVINELSFRYEIPDGVAASSTVINPAPPAAQTVIVYAISNSTFTHRPFDGGILINTFYPIAGLEAKRQTKKYFRYQSGKGVNFSTGALFTPAYDITGAEYTASNQLRVTTDIAHGFQVGVKVALSDITTTGYNSPINNYIYTPYTITAIIDSNTFEITDFGPGGLNDGLNIGLVAGTTASLGISPKVVVTEWSGAAVRTGMFDDANGPYWEYDGVSLYACVRSSTTQVTGTVALTNGSNIITGTNTRFGDQFTAGNKVQIKGQVYEVTNVASSTEMYVNPAYRGVDSSNSKISLITELRIPQSEFNSDTLDGEGPSGYFLHPDRMQMVGIQWSWYGAGYIDYMVRGPLGDWIVAHRIGNSNFNTEAYMRSGNLPARYEVVTSCRHSKVIGSSTGTGNVTIEVANADKLFPTDGGLLTIKSVQGPDILTEVVEYDGITGNQISLSQRGASYTRFLSGSNRTFSGDTTVGGLDHPVNSSVQFIGCNIAPQISHWGSSVILDGGFKSDPGFKFTTAKDTISIPSGTSQTVLLFRPAPAVSNGLPGEVGERELLNRSRITLTSIEVATQDSTNSFAPRRYELAGVLNPSSIDPETVIWESAQSQEYADNGVPSLGYQPSFAQYETTTIAKPEGGELLFKFTTANRSEIFDLTNVKNLENSILGGNGLYPNGPEVLALSITNKSTDLVSFDIVLSWKEAHS